jgi:hypothetical protein
MAEVGVEGQTIRLRLPVLTPDLTLEVTGVAVRGVTVNGVPLQRAGRRQDFRSGTYLEVGSATLLAFDPPRPDVTVQVQGRLAG